jgi:hypothetical protein
MAFIVLHVLSHGRAARSFLRREARCCVVPSHFDARHSNRSGAPGMDFKSHFLPTSDMSEPS